MCPVHQIRLIGCICSAALQVCISSVIYSVNLNRFANLLSGAKQVPSSIVPKDRFKLLALGSLIAIDISDYIFQLSSNFVIGNCIICDFTLFFARNCSS